MRRRISIYLPVSLLLAMACMAAGTGRLTPYTFPVNSTMPPMPAAPGVVTAEGVALGRYLFYDPILSRDSTVSCSSCHRQEAAFSDGGRSYSTGIGGQRQQRNTPGLFNLAWHPSFFADGRAATIEEQVLHPVRKASEMALSWTDAARRVSGSAFYRQQFEAVYQTDQIDSTLIARSIGQFLRTMLSYRSRYDRVISGEASFTRDEYEGFLLVNDQTRADCQHCHVTDGNGAGSTFRFSNNGLDDITDPARYRDKGRGGITGRIDDLGLFKIPSLRNLAFTAPYMHDGRYMTLEQVVDFYSDSVHSCANIDPKMEYASKGGAHLTPDEKRKVVAFLRTLSDSVFVTDPAFSDPFVKR